MVIASQERCVNMAFSVDDKVLIKSLYQFSGRLRTLDKDCRQAEEPKQLVDEASRFHLGRQRQHSAVICSGAL